MYRNPGRTETSRAARTRWCLPAVAASAAKARHLALDQARAWDLRLEEETADTLQLIISELVGNAVRHGAATLITLGLRVDDNQMYVEVSDGSVGAPVERAAACEDESGRGMTLVTALASHWGVRPIPGGKVVWATLTLPATEQARAAAA